MTIDIICGFYFIYDHYIYGSNLIFLGEEYSFQTVISLGAK